MNRILSIEIILVLESMGGGGGGFRFRYYQIISKIYGQICDNRRRALQIPANPSKHIRRARIRYKHNRRILSPNMSQQMLARGNTMEGRNRGGMGKGKISNFLIHRAQALRIFRAEPAEGQKRHIVSLKLSDFILSISEINLCNLTSP